MCDFIFVESDFIVGEVAIGFGCPDIVKMQIGTDAQATAACGEEPAQTAPSLDMVFSVSQAFEEGFCAVGPDFAEWFFADIAQIVMGPELVWVDQACGVDAAYADTAAVAGAAVPRQELVDALGAAGVFTEELEVEVDAVDEIIDGEDVHFSAHFGEAFCAGEDCFDCPAVFGAVEPVFCDLCAPACGDEVVETCPFDSAGPEEFENGFELAHVCTGECEPQARAEADVLAVSYAGDGFVECAVDAAEGVVEPAYAVQTDADVADAEFVQSVGEALGYECAVCGNDGPYSFVGGVCDEVEQVFSHERFAAGKEDCRYAESGEVVNDGDGLVGGKFRLAGRRAGAVVAVGAFEIAGAGDVPDDDGLSLRGFFRRREAVVFFIIQRRRWESVFAVAKPIAGSSLIAI